MIMITLSKIKSKRPCAEGWEKVLKAQGSTKADFNKPFPLSSILESNDFDECIWAWECLPEYVNLRRKFAVWCARSVQHLMADARSIKALDVAWAHSEGLATDDELAAAAGDAGDAAWTAGYAAWAAAGAAGAAAGAGAWATGDAARYAAWAAAGAAGAAAGAKFNEKLKQILDAGEWVK